eukprot:583076_1
MDEIICHHRQIYIGNSLCSMFIRCRQGKNWLCAVDRAKYQSNGSDANQRTRILSEHMNESLEIRYVWKSDRTMQSAMKPSIFSFLPS